MAFAFAVPVWTRPLSVLPLPLLFSTANPYEVAAETGDTTYTEPDDTVVVPPIVMPPAGTINPPDTVTRPAVVSPPATNK